MPFVKQHYAKAPTLELYIYGALAARDLKRFQGVVASDFQRIAAPKLVTAGSIIFKRAIRNEMRPPRYPVDKETGKTYWGRPDTPSGGWGWYSGTYRRSLKPKIAANRPGFSMSVITPDKASGKQPEWARWGKPQNAFDYAAWIEFGEVPGQPKRPIMATAFEKNKVKVAAYIQSRFVAEMKRVEKMTRPKRRFI